MKREDLVIGGGATRSRRGGFLPGPMSTKHSESIGVIVRVRPEAPGDAVDDGGEQPAVAQLDGCSLALFHPSADAGESDAAGAPLPPAVFRAAPRLERR